MIDDDDGDFSRQFATEIWEIPHDKKRIAYIPLTITREFVGLIDSVEVDDNHGNEAKILLDFRRKRQRRLAGSLTDDIMTFELCN